MFAVAQTMGKYLSWGTLNYYFINFFILSNHYFNQQSTVVGLEVWSVKNDHCIDLKYEACPI